MLSCLSPRRPCCGPNAAVRPKSSCAASASSECVRSRVTDAGCASSATRRPASGLRTARSSSSRSMPNFIAPARASVNVAGSWKSGLVAAVRERPVGERAVVGLDDGRESGVERCRLRELRQRRERDLRAQVEAIRHAAALDRGAGHLGRGAVAAAAGEAVGRPVAGRRKVEFVIAVAPIGTQEYLEAGMLPETVAAACKVRPPGSASRPMSPSMRKRTWSSPGPGSPPDVDAFDAADRVAGAL